MKFFNTKKNTFFEKKQGFTLIEVLVAVSLFTVVAITGITAVVVAKSAYEKNQAIKATTDSVMFIVEDISRTARLGTAYRCLGVDSGTTPPSISLTGIEESLDGSNCEGLAYEPFWKMSMNPPDPEDQIIYVFANTTDCAEEASSLNGFCGALYARSMADQTTSGPLEISNLYFQRLTPRNLSVNLAKSGFDVIGANDGNPNTQPRIIFRINGTITERGQSTDISLQTTVSQRAIPAE